MSSVSDPPAASGAAPSVTADALASKEPPFGAARETGSDTERTANPPDVDVRLDATYGKYRVIRLLGQGGMGRVYEGEDTALKRKVAIKFLPEDLVNKPVVIERFMREAQVAGRLNHPNIIAIYDVGREKKDCYIVMELLHPGSAASRIKNKGPYPWPVATRIIADCCAALKIAHEAGIVHRDIKPDNILFSSAGVVKLVDFGLVKLMEDDLHLTQTGAVCGTPLFMSPEQASNQDMDLRSDLYSLGATYYALLTGKAPYRTGGVPQIMLSHVAAPTPDPRMEVSDIPEPCVQVLMRAMEKKPGARYQTAAEMGADLETILAGVGRRAASIFEMEKEPHANHGSLPPGTALGARSMSFVGQSVGFNGRNTPAGLSRRALLVGGGLGALGLALGGTYALRRRTPGQVAAPDPSVGAGPQRVAAASAQPPIKVGVLHSLTGVLAVSERPLADAASLAIEEINGRGGLLGRSLQPVLMDGKSETSTDSAFTRAAERLLQKEKVAAVFGGYGSAGRKAIIPYFEKYEGLLFYPAPYEGLEESQNVIYTGATPNQLVLPAVEWCMQSLGRQRFFLIGTDGLRPHAMNAIAEDAIREARGKIVGTHYALVGEVDFTAIVRKIEKADPQVILSMLVGDSTIAFLKALSEADITPEARPVVSLALGENELAQLGQKVLAGNYVARTRFQRLPQDKERDQGGDKGDGFAQRFRKKYGAHRAVSEIMESAYVGVHLWAAAVERAGSEDASKVRLALKEKEYDLAGVRVRVDASNQHTWKVFEVGRITSDNTIDVVKTGDTPLPPIPFPPPRTSREWSDFAEGLHKQWGDNWANPEKPRMKTKKERRHGRGR
jgi:urea transport system substrate-binding protein